MTLQHIALSNWQRLLMGDASWSFAAEVALRALVVYVMLLGFMRLMGKRLAAGLSITELAVILTLGAAGGLPLESVDQGVLPTAVVLVVGLGFQRGLSLLSFQNRWFEVVSLGDVVALLIEGSLQPGPLKASQLSNAKLFSVLRPQGILHLGQARRVYLEASGQLSVITYLRERPGLSIVPGDIEKALGLRRVPAIWACSRCGRTRQVPSDNYESAKPACENCGGKDWEQAVCLHSGFIEHHGSGSASEKEDGPVRY